MLPEHAGILYRTEQSLRFIISYTLFLGRYCSEIGNSKHRNEIVADPMPHLYAEVAQINKSTTIDSNALMIRP